MFEDAFHYERRRLENDVVALEPFDVSGYILLEYRCRIVLTHLAR